MAKLAALARELLGISLVPVLDQNAPNPFNPVTTISYTLPQSGEVRLTVYAVTGQEVVTQVAGYREAGFHRVTWDAGDCANGVYLYRLEAGSFVETKRMPLLK